MQSWLIPYRDGPLDVSETNTVIDHDSYPTSVEASQLDDNSVEKRTQCQIHR
jgi:hypothetical protein